MTAPKARRPRGRPRIPKEVQRRRLLSAALRAYERNRFAQTRVADIVAEAGMSSRSFYEFFHAKEDLVVELVEISARALLKNLESVFAATADPLERIERGLAAFLQLYAGEPLDLDRMGDEAGLRVREVRRSYLREITARVARELGNAHAAGLASRPPEFANVELVLTGIEGLAARYFAEGRGKELQELLPTFQALIVRVFI